VNFILIFVLLVLSALFSGLNLGLMSLNPHELKRKTELGDKKAKKVYPVRKNGNYLLVTLLLGNVAVNAVLAIFLGSLTAGLLAVVLTTALITIFGEIIPQAVLSRHALAISYRVVWIVKFFMIILFPISKPTAMALDKILGEELPTIYSKKELVNIINEHSVNDDSDVESHEEQIARGALTFADKKVNSVMTPKSVVRFLREDQMITLKLLLKLKDDGFTRFPVLEKRGDKVIGIFYIKDLLGEDIPKRVSALMRTPALFINKNSDIDDALTAFLKNRKHLFVVVDRKEEVVGVLTMEDVVEEIIGDEIVDEFDKYDDLRAVASLQAKTKR
jgi:metal transporter CNNM